MDYDLTVEEEVNQIKFKTPHVVILGAGASRATCPKGDKNGIKLPLMKDFVDIVGLRYLLEKWNINPNENFEEIYSDIDDRNQKRKITKIQDLIKKYFSKIALPDKPTIYDHLVLSLRKKDLIATFNWDPLLIQAYLRNRSAGLSLPEIVFLHGNIRIGYCEKDKILGLVEERCKQCDMLFKNIPLLYPIKKKDYAKNPYITNAWEKLKRGLKHASMITIFGYSAPQTDQEAFEAMKGAWGDKDKRKLEQTEFITKQKKVCVRKKWDQFIHTHHYCVHNNFYNSWIAHHPRRTVEAYWNVFMEVKNIDKNSIPKDLNFPRLWKWYEKFKEAER